MFLRKTPAGAVCRGGADRPNFERIMVGFELTGAIGGARIVVSRYPMADAVKCACPSCSCDIPQGKGIERDGKLYCSETCAYDCTEQTCVCVHDRCDEKR